MTKQKLIITLIIIHNFISILRQKKKSKNLF